MSYAISNFYQPCFELLSAYVSPLALNTSTGQYGPVAITGIGNDAILAGYIDGWDAMVRQGTRRIQTVNRRFVNNIPTTLDHSVTFKEILRVGNQNYFGSDQSQGGSLLVAAAAASPYLKFQLSSGRTSGVGTTWLFYGVWTALTTPIDSDDIPVFTLEMSPFDPGFAGAGSGPSSSVLYYTSGYTAPFSPS